MGKNKISIDYASKPNDSDIQNVLIQLAESKQRSFLKFLQFVKDHEVESSQPLTFVSPLNTHKKSISIPLQEFNYVHISEIEIWNFIQVLKRICDSVPKPLDKKGVVSILLGLSNPEIVTGPDEKKYVIGLDRDVVSKTHKILLDKYGEVEIVKVEKKIVHNFVEPKHKKSSRYFLGSKNNQGYFQFFKQGPHIPIGKTNTRKWKLMSELIVDGACVTKSVEAVFEKIMLEKDKFDGRLQKNDTRLQRQVDLIGYVIDELQKIKDLRGKITLLFNRKERSIRLNFK